MSLISEEKIIAKEKKRLHNFGIVMGTFFLLVGSYLFWKESAFWKFILSVSAIFFILTFISPKLLSPLERAWMALGEKISKIMTILILASTFFLVITPMACLLKILRKDVLNIKFFKLSEPKNSFWIRLENKADNFRPWEPY